MPVAHGGAGAALMGVVLGRSDGEFASFVARSEPVLRRALTATYGPVLGREAAVDALSWAWEHWDRLAPMENPVGYLYRVGQTAARRQLRRAVAGPATITSDDVTLDAADVVPELEPALHQLSPQQRAAVVLVHGYGMPLREVADVLEISVATVREHVGRALIRLRAALEVPDAC